MRKKIFIFQMMLVVIGISVMAFAVFRISHDTYMRELENGLRGEANTVIAELKSSDRDFMDRKDQIDYYQALAKKFAGIFSSGSEEGYRVTVVDYDGEVIGDSEADPLQTKSHKYRPEILSAISSGWGKDIRVSDTLKKEFIYYAVAVPEKGIVVRVAEPIVYVENIDRQIIMFTTLALLAGLVLTAGISAAVSNRLTRPIIRLKESMESIRNGNYAVRIYDDYTDEMKDLSSGFNDMAEKLQSSVKDLEDKSNELEAIAENMVSGMLAVDSSLKVITINGMARDILGMDKAESAIGSVLYSLTRKTEFTELLEKELEDNVPISTIVASRVDDEERVYRVNVTAFVRAHITEFEKDNRAVLMMISDVTQIKKLENMRSEFVSNVSHELKTPLTSIKGFVETLKKGAIDKPDVARGFLDIIDLETERLYSLINDILDLSEIETMKTDVSLEIVDLRTIINDVFGLLAKAAEDKGVALECTVDEPIFVKVNRNRVKQLLMNVIDNGVKYNRSGGSVRVSSSVQGGFARLSVEDTGIGIPDVHKGRVFERFYRVDAGRSREMGGTGLGLSIVKHIAQLYNIGIDMESSEGKGTVFTFTFIAE